MVHIKYFKNQIKSKLILVPKLLNESEIKANFPILFLLLFTEIIECCFLFFRLNYKCEIITDYFIIQFINNQILNKQKSITNLRENIYVLSLEIGGWMHVKPPQNVTILTNRSGIQIFNNWNKNIFILSWIANA